MKCINYFFFFFQAEDGIRDYKVTGVQTCALPISTAPSACSSSTPTPRRPAGRWAAKRSCTAAATQTRRTPSSWGDRKSTRLNSSHLVISYAVFCLKKKKKNRDYHTINTYTNIYRH